MNTGSNGIQYRDCDKGILKQVEDYNALNISKGDIVLDLGANIGAFSYNLKDKVRQLVAVKPAEENYKVLEANYGYGFNIKNNRNRTRDINYSK